MKEGEDAFFGMMYEATNVDSYKRRQKGGRVKLCCKGGATGKSEDLRIHT
jgi:hypothetical protein